MATKLSAQEQDVQILKEALSRYPMWVNETEVIARGLVSNDIGSLTRVKEEYEKEITKLEEEISEKTSRISELVALNAEYARVLTAIRELTCAEIGIKIDEAQIKSEKKQKD